MKIQKVFLGAFTGLALLLTACTGAGTVSGETDIVIGGILPMSGDAVGLGLPMQQGAELAVTDINAAWAEAGMTFDIIWEDGQCTGTAASAAAQKLVNVDGMEVILGGLCSSETLAAAPIAEAAGTVLFSATSSSPAVTDAGDYVFRNWPSDQVQGERMAALADELGYEKVVMLTETTDYTAGIAAVFTENFSGTVVEEAFLTDDVDLKTPITKLLAEEGVDAWFINPQTDTKSTTLFKQMQEMGVEGPFLLNDVAGTQTDILTDYAELIEGAYTATFALDEESEGVQAFVASHEETYGEANPYLAYSVAMYDAAWILAEAIAEVGNDGDAVREYLEDYSGEGLMGPTSFDENGDFVGGHSIFQVIGGELVRQ